MGNRITVETVGVVSIKRDEATGSLYLAYWNPARQAMTLLSTRTEKLTGKGGAREQADALNNEIENNPATRAQARRPLLLREAMDLAIQHSRSRDAGHRKNLGKCRDYFLNFMGARFPRVKVWSEVDAVHLDAYAHYLTNDQDCAAKTVRNYLSIATMTARYLSRNYRKARIYEPLIAPPVDSDRNEIEKHYLDLAGLRKVIATAAAMDEEAAGIGFVLGGMCGLRIWEIARLSFHDLDFRAGVLNLDRIKTKNQQSARVLPIVQEAVDFISAVMERRRENAPTWLVCRVPRKGESAGQVTHAADYSITKPMRRVLRAAGFPDVDPKDARKTAANLMDAAGVDPWRRDAYLGHAPKGTAERHYVDRNSARMVEVLRREVVDRLETVMSAETAPATSAALIQN